MKTHKLIGPLAVALGFILIGCSGPPRQKNNVRHYAQTLEKWMDTGLVDHFPKTIPADASGVVFSSFPGYLQAGGWIQLRIETSKVKIELLYEDAMKRAKQYHDGGDRHTMINRQKNGLGSGSFRTSESGDPRFPIDYRVFILDAKPYLAGDHVSWNHGRSKGVSICREKNIVVFWAERW